ncbi:MAG: leucyl aminopeptidase, partial [Pseudomonadota bacterium]|nr:leucyl aminopeptidase [Pseudomonadota bacterium]
MADRAEIRFVKLEMPKAGSAVVLTDEKLALGPAATALGEAAGGRFARAAMAAKFEGKPMKSIQLLAPAGVELDRVVFVGMGDLEKLKPQDWLKLGGTIPSAAAGEAEVTVLLQLPAGDISAEQAANVALGISLRSYSFDKYKTKKKNDEAPKPRIFALAVQDPKSASKAWNAARAVADGVAVARDLVNEPANTLGPVEFADQLGDLSALGVEVEVLGEDALRDHKMGALLGVAQGSERPPRVVILRWKGGRDKDKPVAFVGKGVVFDSGGISIKPAAGMEDMKGDMGGAAAVAGLFHALAARKAKVNAIGIVGLVENMVDGKAQRPGDVVTSMSGQTIEVINTDAEGRLVLADILTYIQRNEKPAAIIDLATLTGAIIVALGNHHAGLFSNNDELADDLLKAGRETGEKVWRMPLGPEYDKLIDSKIADMKNTGGRHAGSVTAAQFLQRFVENDTPWAHIDVAGTA